MRCLSLLPPEWRDEIAGLGEGQTFERMGKAWFYLPPNDEEDCIWEATVRDGILHVEFEVGPEWLRRKFDIPVSSLESGIRIGTEHGGKAAQLTPKNEEEEK